MAAEREVMQQALDALKVAHAGLEWYRDGCPDDVNGSDEEADEVVGNAMQALRDAIGAAMPRGWASVERGGMPPCDDETVYVGINTAGFACCFNEVTRDGVCSMRGPELSTVQMSALKWWRVLDRPDVAGVDGGQAPGSVDPAQLLGQQARDAYEREFHADTNDPTQAQRFDVFLRGYIARGVKGPDRG